MTTDADRIAAEGVPLVLTDGRTVSLRYGLKSLRVLEAEFGSIATMDTLFAPDGPVISNLLKVMSAGLVHEEGFTPDALADLLDTRQLQTYIAVVATAIEQAVPEGAPSAVGNAPVDPPGSLGGTSTTS